MNQKQINVLRTTWFKENGLSEKKFSSTDVHLLRAQKTAHNLLEHQSHLLTNTQTIKLKTFIHSMKNPQLQKKISKGTAYAVLNIQNKINRQNYQLKK
jgi:hypothetical protein